MTNNVKTPRYLEPPEIELWELAKKATPGPWLVEREEREPEAGEEWRMRVVSLDPEEKYVNLIEGAYFVIDQSGRPGENAANAAFISKANPLAVAALLETLEKTREAAEKLVNVPVVCKCGEDERRMDGGEPWPHTPDCATAIQDEVRALLSGFSGDASKEEELSWHRGLGRYTT